jgi:peptide/nickel transport system permease protein
VSVYIIRRLLQSVVVLFIMSILVFVGIYVVGDPVDIMLNPEADQAEMERVIREFGFDKPIWEQYFDFLGGALRGNLGNSFVFNIPAIQLILQRLPATMELAAVGMGISVLFGIPLGIIAGLKPDTLTGRSIMAGSILGFSLPNFWQGVMLIMLFSVFLGWLPSSGRGETVVLGGIHWSIFTADGFSRIILPAVNLALFKMSLVIRLTRAGTREVMLQDYVKFARAKGLPERRVINVHVLKNIMIPVVTIIGLEFGSLIAFAVVTETVFAWPGMGKLLIDSINLLDRPVIVAYLLLIVFLFIIINLLVDIAYSIIDPRVRLQDVKA